MKTKYILFAWVWPIFSIFLFVVALLLLIHEGAFHNGQREVKLYTALGLVIITFINGIVAVLISGHYKKPDERHDFINADEPLPHIKFASDQCHPVKIKYMKRGVCNDCGNRILNNEYFCELCINKGCINDRHDSLCCENSNDKP